MPAPDRPESAACLNCGQPFALPRPNYCPSCGQDTRERVPRLRELLRQFTGAYLSTEGALWRTLALLATRPGALTTEYLAGRRRRYVLPVRLYLSISLVLLLALRLAAPLEIDASKLKLEHQPDNFAILEWGGARAGVENGRFVCEQMPAWVCRRLERRLDLDPKALTREFDAAVGRFFSHWGTAMFVLLPLFAGWTQLAHLGRGLRYAEHLVFAVHVHSAWFVLLLATLAANPAVTGTALLLMPLYHLLAARRVYGRGWWGTLWRAGFVAFAYGLTLAFTLAAVLVATVLV